MSLRLDDASLQTIGSVWRPSALTMWPTFFAHILTCIFYPFCFHYITTRYLVTTDRRSWQPALSPFRDCDTRRWLMMGLGFQKCFPLRGGAFMAERISGCALCTRVLGREVHCSIRSLSDRDCLLVKCNIHEILFTLLAL